MSYWRKKGSPVEKLNMGFPVYGRTFKLASQSSDVGAKSSGPASAGAYTKESGFWSYYEVKLMILHLHANVMILFSFQICTFLQGATIHMIKDQKVPYAVKQNEWVGYDDKASFETKVLT